MPVTRKKLYRQVWAAPMLKVAKRYGVSSSFLARICKRMNVPMPGRGYWAKHAAGQTLPQTPLPAPRPGDLMQWSRGGDRAAAAGLPTVLRTAVVSRRRRRGDERPTHHELVVDVREQFLGGRVTRAGYLRPTKTRLVDIFVSDTALDAALEVADKLSSRSRIEVIACASLPRATCDTDVISSESARAEVSRRTTRCGARHARRSCS
jgi:hypothetical protein